MIIIYNKPTKIHSTKKVVLKIYNIFPLSLSQAGFLISIFTFYSATMYYPTKLEVNIAWLGFDYVLVLAHKMRDQSLRANALNLVKS